MLSYAFIASLGALLFHLRDGRGVDHVEVRAPDGPVDRQFQLPGGGLEAVSGRGRPAGRHCAGASEGKSSRILRLARKSSDFMIECFIHVL